MTGVGSVVLHDIPPFVMASGNTASAHGLNTEGLRRRGFDAATLTVLRRAYRTLYRSELTLQQAREQLAADLAALLADPPEWWDRFFAHAAAKATQPKTVVFLYQNRNRRGALPAADEPP
jgi:hypothetical protein